MRLTVVIFLLPILALAQGKQSIPYKDNKVQQYLNAYSGLNESETPVSYSKVINVLNKLSVKKQKFKNDQAFLTHVFAKVHQQFLRQFRPYATFTELLTTGRYNCLTGTALYALTLEHLGYHYEIIETNYHIFIIANTTKDVVLFEATDPLNGFVSNSTEVEKKIAQYKQNTQTEVSNSKHYYQYNVSLYNKVDLDEVLGLLHYNMAVKAYNDNDLFSSINHLEKASQLYDSKRLEEFTHIVLLTVLEAKLDASTKNALRRRLESLKKSQLQLVASKR